MSDLPLYQQIYNDYVDAIVSGKIALGDKLPTEKNIAASYGVSRITSKRAMEQLRDDGFIERTPGRGSYVINNRKLKVGQPGMRAGRGQGGQPMIGLIMPDFSESYGMEIVTGVERSIRDHGYNMLFRRSMFNLEDENRAIADLYKAGCEGLILMPQHNDYFNDRILRLILDHFPVVIIDRDMHGIDTTFISSDNYNATLDAVSQLIELGHEDIIFLSYPVKSASTLEERMKGFRDAFYRHQLYWNEELHLDRFHEFAEITDFETRTTKDLELLKSFIRQHPEATAIFATEYNFAQLAIRAVDELGFRVPDDFSIIGYDGPSSTTGNTFLTRILQPQEEMGWLAVDILDKIIRGEDHAKLVKLESEIRGGHSVAEVRYIDPDRPRKRPDGTPADRW